MKKATPKIKRRLIGKGERWTKKCRCGSFIPKEYRLCDGCLIGQFSLDVTSNPCCDPLGMTTLLYEEQVIPVLRHMLGETVVDIHRQRRR